MSKAGWVLTGSWLVFAWMVITCLKQAEKRSRRRS